MRCPKCQYIGFDEGDRCRNCGYDFSLAAAEAPLDLPIRGDGGVEGPMVDLALADRVPDPPRQMRPTPSTPAGPRRSLATGFDLPLFGGDDDAPLVTPPAVPRTPLSVRRTAPHTPRSPLAASDAETDDGALPRPIRRRHPEPERSAGPDPGTDLRPAAPAGRRLLAAAIDLAIIGGIDAGVVYFTLRVCGLAFAEIGALPIVPLVVFLLMLNGGYATLFTAAAGQTIGKMMTGIRVVPAAAESEGGLVRMPVSTAVVREAACLLSLVPAGLGFLMALVRADGRALHDTLVDTRVVRA